MVSNHIRITSQNKAKCKVDQSGDSIGKIIYLEINSDLKVAIQQAKLNPLEFLESQSWRVLLKFGVMLRLCLVIQEPSISLASSWFLEFY